MSKRAIFHVDNTEGILEFADYLISAGWTIISANKTEELLRKQKIPVIHENGLSESNLYFADSARLMNQIVSTRYNYDADSQESDNNNNIYIVCMNVTPQLKTLESSNPFETSFCPSDFFISSIIRNSFSNYENLLILTDPVDYKEAMIQLKTGEITPQFRGYLAAKALDLLSAYDGGISSSVLQHESFDNPFTNYLSYPFKKEIQFSKGLNKHQTAYLYKIPVNSEMINKFQKIQGKELSYAETSDGFFAWEQISTLYTILKNQFKVKSTNADGYDFTTQFTPLTGTVFTLAVKFNSIIGAALSTNTIDSFKKTFSYDTENTSNVVLACSAVIDAAAAQEIMKHSVSTVIAPSFANDAKQIFSMDKNIRLIPTGKLRSLNFDGKLTSGGFLLQTKDSTLFDHWKVKTKNRPSQALTDEMAFGMLLAMRARSYSSILLKDNMIVGIAQGCTSTKKAVEGVLYEAKMNAIRNSIPEDAPLGDVLICDAEIDFTESVKELIDSGVTAIIQTGGTPSDNEFINYCDEKGIVMIFTEMTHISF